MPAAAAVFGWPDCAVPVGCAELLACSCVRLGVVRPFERFGRSFSVQFVCAVRVRRSP